MSCHYSLTSYLCLQRIRSTVDEREQKQLLKELDVVMLSNDCQYIVQFYGALFREVSRAISIIFLLNLHSMNIIHLVYGDPFRHVTN